MMSPARRLAGGILALALAISVAALSRLPHDPTGNDDAMIRLSWRTPGELVNECRKVSQEELERQPLHMRREEICEGRIVPYHLRVILDGRVELDETVRAAGAREDRPLYVHRELRVSPGEHRIEVQWERDGGGADEGRSGLSLQSTLELAAREVALITYDLDRRVLVSRGGRSER
jgi:hypothetical protein